ncbi:MATE family efflux transporter [Priestia endophytica]|jgi:multidrug resistance protein, MATE family|uniref:MATE family efflux transporter n=1 Tax=Priestia endophytica TaxID=135735 RepID=UPI000F5295D2|nr:MATE family efflux transporter [Priestia endophytica]MED4073479.1 MATE family efflux transporter [Priestia endophytica]RPK13080.1 hypothetical protein FH5_03286 [Priestia endophytica]
MRHKEYLSLAIPLMLSTMTTPILGAVDTAVVGHVSGATYIGAVAIGSLIFSTIYWLFGFLRVSTSGFSAQAVGKGAKEELLHALTRPMFLALLVGVSFILLQWPIGKIALMVIKPSQEVQELALNYFYIRIWGAPFALITYVILGFLIGTGRVKLSLFLQIGMNVVNIVLDFLFVQGFGWAVKGVAFATLIAEVSGALVGMIIIAQTFTLSLKKWSFVSTADFSSFKKMLEVNRDLFIRTFCLIVMYNMFTAKGADFGTEILAANAILLQIQFIMAYCLDGFANATSIVVGRAVGSNNESLYNKGLSLTTYWGLIVVCFLSLCYFFMDSALFSLFTNDMSTIEAAKEYSFWLTLFPFATGAGLLFYGVFTGATRAKPIRDSTIFALFFFLASYFLLPPFYGNHGLWIAFLVFNAGRSLFLVASLPKLKKQVLTKGMSV